MCLGVTRSRTSALTFKTNEQRFVIGGWRAHSTHCAAIRKANFRSEAVGMQ